MQSEWQVALGSNIAHPRASCSLRNKAVQCTVSVEFFSYVLKNEGNSLHNQHQKMTVPHACIVLIFQNEVRKSTESVFPLSIHWCLRSIVTSGTWAAIDPELRSKSKQEGYGHLTRIHWYSSVMSIGVWALRHDQNPLLAPQASQSGQNTQWLPSKLHPGLIGKVSTITLLIGCWTTSTSESWHEKVQIPLPAFFQRKGHLLLILRTTKDFARSQFSVNLTCCQRFLNRGTVVMPLPRCSGHFETCDFLVCPAAQLHLSDKLCIGPSLPPGQIETHEPHFYANLVLPSSPPWKASSQSL